MADALELILSEIKKLNLRFDGLESRMDSMQADIQVLKAGQTGLRVELTDRFNELKADIYDLRNDVEITFHETSRNKLDIERIKRHI